MMARKAWYQECEEISYIAFIIRKSKKNIGAQLNFSFCVKYMFTERLGKSVGG